MTGSPCAGCAARLDANMQLALELEDRRERIDQLKEQIADLQADLTDAHAELSAIHRGEPWI